jgi:hypothetical protein
MNPSDGAGFVATWVLGNASAITVVYRWLTGPLEAKIAALEKKLDAALEGMEKRVEKIDGYVNPRQSMIDSLPTMGELVRRVQELEKWKSEMDGELVTDEEFREHAAIVTTKIERLIGDLGWIRGRLGGRVE